MKQADDQGKKPLSEFGISSQDMMADLGMIIHRCADDDFNARLRASAQGAIVAIQKLQDMAPLMEHLFQTFAAGYYGSELHDAISAVWKEWAK